LTPWWGVELAGWGYYLERTWEKVRDHTAATALVLDDGSHRAALVAVDLMYADIEFTNTVRRHAARFTDIPPGAICVGCSHSHNTPTAALIRGAGQLDRDYHRWAALQAATAVILAWKQRQQATMRVGRAELPGWTVNRAREGGPVDTRLSLWRFDNEQGRTFAVVLNFQAHPTVMMQLGTSDLSRDWPGQATDLIETAIPGSTALFFQGACGDVNFAPEWNQMENCTKPGCEVATRALNAWKHARLVERPEVACTLRDVTLPTRRWAREEILRDREEAEYRLRTGDTTGWLEGLARVIVNQPAKLPSRYGGDVKKAVAAIARFGVEWTAAALSDLDYRSETLTTQVHAIRVGDAWLVSNPSEFFTALALDVRRNWHHDLLIAGYANDSIGYLPDAHDVERRTYAAYQSPKFKNQFPFTAESGNVMVKAMLDALKAVTPGRSGPGPREGAVASWG
jgi:hypothetical protein